LSNAGATGSRQASKQLLDSTRLPYIHHTHIVEQHQVQDAAARIAEAKSVSDLPALQSRLAAKEDEAAADDVWADAAAGQALMAEIADLKAELQEIRGWVVGGERRARAGSKGFSYDDLD